MPAAPSLRNRDLARVPTDVGAVGDARQRRTPREWHEDGARPRKWCREPRRPLGAQVGDVTDRLQALDVEGLAQNHRAADAGDRAEAMRRADDVFRIEDRIGEINRLLVVGTGVWAVRAEGS